MQFTSTGISSVGLIASDATLSSMVSFTLSSALVAALTATAANAAGNFAYFTAHTVVTSGQMKFTGKFREPSTLL